MKKKLHLIELENIPIFEQLQIEEALLRLDHRNVCLFNHSAPLSIVLGVSARVDEVVDHRVYQEQQIPLIRRFSGGGTVIVDENTLFVSFIFQKTAHPFSPFPEKIMRWSADLYKQALRIQDFDFKENDYVVNHHKVGGNAQYIQRTKWLHHTSFLYEYEPKNMQYLLMPKKTPLYRQRRSHQNFLTTLKKHLPDSREFFRRVKNHLAKHYEILPYTAEEVQTLVRKEHRKTTQNVTFLPIT